MLARDTLRDYQQLLQGVTTSSILSNFVVCCSDFGEEYGFNISFEFLQSWVTTTMSFKSWAVQVVNLHNWLNNAGQKEGNRWIFNLGALTTSNQTYRVQSNPCGCSSLIMSFSSSLWQFKLLFIKFNSLVQRYIQLVNISTGKFSEFH